MTENESFYKELLTVAEFVPIKTEFPDAWIGHTPFASWLIRTVKPNIFVELGTHSGNSYFAFCQSVQEFNIPTTCYAVDTWFGDEHAGRYDESVFSYVNAFNQAHFSDFSRLLKMKFDDAVEHFADASIDLLHIDGLHTYEAVKHDFETWLPKMAPNALVLFHDTNVKERNFGVWKLFKELKKEYPDNIEFFHSSGLGIIQIGRTGETKTLPWLIPDSSFQQQIKDYFQALGERQQERYSIRLLRTQVASLNQTIVERDVQIASINQALTERDRQITQILSSNSWKITRPLREISRLLNQLAAKKRLPKKFCQILSGQIRAYGLNGVFRRIPYYWHNRHRALDLVGSQPLAANEKAFHFPPPTSADIRLHPDLIPGDKQITESISCIIPTLNAGPEFSLLLRKLMTQRGLESIEIVIVDSGSTDETVRIARAEGCTVVEINPADFSHSFARNVGADAASGRYLLFMVQDAFPIGSYWIYGMLTYLQEHSDQRLAAVSCSEYSRSDSDMMYDSIINTHYRFLGCLEYDRIGMFRGEDHMSLRANGQLSDVACLIAKELFALYRYRGDYAEDLDLGIRLIKDGYRVAMLSSVKVIHSHNRPAFYYLKRGFVDMVFLSSLFPDFSYPQIHSPQGIVAGIVSVATHLSLWRRAFDTSGSSEVLLHLELKRYINMFRKEFHRPLLDRQPCCLDHGRLDTCIDSLGERYLSVSGAAPKGAFRMEMDNFLATFITRLEHFNGFVASVYDHQDNILRLQLRDAILKTFAATAGTSLAFMHIGSADFTPQDRQMTETLFNELKEGI